MSEIQDRIITLAEGIPGAVVAMAELANTQPDVIALLDTLDELDIRGSYIWVGYKDHCEKDTEEFADAIRSEDDAMLAEIEEYRELRNGES